MTIPSIAQRRADFIELIARQGHTRWRSEDGFNMSDVKHYCGSPSCLEGFAIHECARIGIELPDLDENFALPLLLGLPGSVALSLFYGSFSDKLMQNITPADAVEALRSVFAKHPVGGDAS